jgi:hypothetical protein
MKRTVIAFATAAVLAACADAPTAPVTAAPDVSSDLQAASSVTYFGKATVLQVKTLVLNLNLVQAHVGPTQQSPSFDYDALLQINVPGIITGQIADASVDAKNGRTVSRAEVADLTLLAGLNTIRVRLLRSTAESTCKGSGGFSDILGLTVNGKTIRVSGHPNQTIPLILGKLVINEQYLQPSIGKVTALHLKVGFIDVKVSEAIASVKCYSH